MCADKADAKLIEKKMIEIISDQIGVDESELTHEVSFINDLCVDSLDVVELIMQFEDEFDVNIPEEETEGIQTVGDAVDYVINLIKPRSKD